MDLITRKELGWEPIDVPPANTCLGMIVHYDGSNPSSRTLLADWKVRGHRACVDYWQRTRVAHVQGNGWSDIGYAYFVCPDRKVFEGRGYGRQQAAELPTPGKIQDGNRRYVSVTFGLSKGERPTDGQLSAWADLRDWLLNVKMIHDLVYGHRDFTATDCPGSKLYELVQDGTLKAMVDGNTHTPDGDLVSNFPILKAGTRSFDVLTVRALLFERYLASRWDPATSVLSDPIPLWGWMRNQLFTNGMEPNGDPRDNLETDVISYQRWAFQDEPSEWDGIVGSRTMRKLLRIG